MARDAIDLGDSTKFNMDDEWYNKFCNQVERDDKRSERVVFSTDWQRFLWAFILGIFVGKRTPIQNKTKNPPFGAEVFKNRGKILKLMIGLALQEMYKGEPQKLKTDYEKATEKGESLGKDIRICIEEFANTGFAVINQRSIEQPGYIENLEYVIADILSDKGWM